MNSSPCQACLGRWHCIFWGRQAQRWHRWTMKVKGHRDLLSGLGTPCAHGGSCQKLGYRCVPQHLKHLQRDSQICTKHCRIHCKFSWKLLFKSPLHIWRSDGISMDIVSNVLSNNMYWNTRTPKVLGSMVAALGNCGAWEMVLSLLKEMRLREATGRK